MTDRLDDIQAALDRFQMEEARALAAAELQENPSAAAYYLAAQAALNHGQRVAYLQKSLEADPSYQLAIDELAGIAQPGEPATAAQPPPQEAPVAEPPAAPAKPEASTVILAPLRKRLVALIIDSFIVAIFSLVLIVTSQSFANLSTALQSGDEFLLRSAIEDFQSATVPVNFLVSAVYNLVLMTLFNGQTLGKIFLKIRVIKKNGRRFSLLDALLRNVFGYSVSQIMLLGYLWAIVDEEQQTWHDKIANTVVVIDGARLPR